MLCGPLLEQDLAKDLSRPRGISSVIIHETADPLLLTHHGKGRGASPGQLSEAGQRAFGIRFEQRNVSDQRDPVEFSQIIARPIEDAAIQMANDTIVFYPAGHHERKQGMSGEKIQYLGFMLAFERLNRLSEFGAVITNVGYGISQEGFDGEWREVGIATFDGELISRWEMFDDADLNAALARFDELNRPAP